MKEMRKKNTYCNSAEYYDFLENKKRLRQEIIFLTRVLQKAKVKTILDVGCGTGLYLVGLKKKGFEVEGLDFSKKMLNEVRKKDPKIKLYQKDMSSFKLTKKYDAVICLSSTLVALPKFGFIKKTLKNIFNVLIPGGIFILDLPNHSVEIKKCNNVPKTISGKIPQGMAEFTFFSTKKGNKWEQLWRGKIIRNGKKVKFQELWEELIYFPKKLEDFLEKLGFIILKTHGSIEGEKFDKNESYHKTYVLKKIN